MGYITGFRAAALGTLAAIAAVAFAPSTVLAAEGDAPAQTTTAQPTESAGAPIALKRFTKKRVRTASAKTTRRNAGKASLAQRAKAGQSAETSASRKTKPDVDKLADAPASSTKLTPQIANANAFYNPSVNNSAAAPTMPGLRTPDASATDMTPASPSSDVVEVAEAADVNDIDKAAWAPKDVPKLSPAILDSRAEMQDEDSRWANTSTIGKIFVAIGAMLTVGSAIRMFVA